MGLVLIVGAFIVVMLWAAAIAYAVHALRDCEEEGRD
jgi:hypothetical protein